MTAVSIDRLPDHADATETLLGQAARTADGGKRRWLYDEAVRINVPVATSVARRFRNRGIPDDDLVQVACLGLVQAVRRFDADQGHDFLSFAVPTMRGELRRHFRDQGWMVRPPRQVQELQARLGQAGEELTQTLGRTPGTRELADDLDVPEEDVRAALAATGCFTPTSLDRAGEGGAATPLVDRIGVEDSQRAVDARIVLAPLVRQLAERDREILRLRFFEGRSQREIGEEIGVTQMQVSRLLTRILRDLRRGIEGNHPDR